MNENRSPDRETRVEEYFGDYGQDRLRSDDLSGHQS